MNRFILQIENWGNWQNEDTFTSKASAIRFGKDHFPQNEWRIFDADINEVVFFHDPVNELQQEARMELDRFQATNHWRQVYNEREQARVQMERSQMQINRLNEIAGQLRNQLRGRQVSFSPFSFSRSYCKEPVNDKFDWKKEGF